MTTGKQQVSIIGQMCQTLDKMEPSLNESLKGTGVSTQRFLATAKTAIQTHQDKSGLEQADRNSLYLAIKKAASDGLMPDGREAALIVRSVNVGTKTNKKWEKQVSYQPMVQGLVKLARNSGEIDSIGAYIVYEKDKFSYRAGVDPIPQHDAEWFSSDRGKPIGIWAFVKLKSGDYLDPVMLTKERIDRIATRSKVAKNYNPGEGLDWEEWWKKAAIRNILKYAPKSTALDSALKAHDEEFNFDDEDITLNAEPPVEPKPRKKRTTKAAAAVKEAVAEEVEPDDDNIIDAEVIEEQPPVVEEEDLTEEIPV